VSDTVLSDVIQALGLAVIERLPNSTYHLLTASPHWLTGAFEAAPAGAQGTLAGALPFLDHFLNQAETAWYEGPPATAESGPFAARVSGEDLLLRATAFTIGRRRLLVLERLTGEADTRPILQRAREHLLEAERLTRQIGTVHAPAAAIERELSALSATSLSADQQRIVDALRQASAKVQAAMATLPAPPPKSRR
jgi:hypothetical protein